MKCSYCHEKIAPAAAAAEAGADKLHQECLIRMVAGSSAHQLRECRCFRTCREDPPYKSKRESARLAYETFLLLHPAAALR